MSLLDDLRMYRRFAFGLRRFLRETLTIDEARARIRRNLSEREPNFLRILERAVFAHPRSPYLPLFRQAHCHLGDVRAMLRERGLEPTLLALREAGVYVSFEECKGRRPIVRGGREFPVAAHDFDNPLVRAQYYSESGGSTGAGTRVHHDLDFMKERSPHEMLTYAVHGVLDAPQAVWRGVLPDGSGVNIMLCCAGFGRPPARWFSPTTHRGLAPRLLKFRVANTLVVALGNVFGTRIPWPEHVPVDRAEIVARWAASAIDTHGTCMLNMVASRALRVSLAAQRHGIDLTGAVFVVAGEPVTPAKVRGIRRSGATCFPTYGFSEAGRIGMGCVAPVSVNDLHLMTSMCAMITYPRAVPGSEIMVPAFNVTSLLPAAPKILINAESDDYGILETRRCGCPLEDAGFTTHIREIRSFGKLTGEGVTMVGSEMEHILEEILPARFGGSALDYQLMEEEEADGFTRVSLIVSPEVPITDESLVVQAVLEAMSRESLGADAARQIWGQSGTLRVKRMRPVLTARGKLLPLHIPGRHGAPAAQSPTLVS